MTTPPLAPCLICGRDPRLDTRQSVRRFAYGDARKPACTYAFICSNRHCAGSRSSVYSGLEAYARTRWNKDNGGGQ